MLELVETRMNIKELIKELEGRKRTIKKYLRIIKKQRQQLQTSQEEVKEIFEDKIVEAILCSCDAIQKLKVKDADNIAKHKRDCIYVFCKKKYGGKR